MTVVAPVELDDEVSPCEAAGSAKSAHRGLSAAGHAAQHLHARAEFRHSFSEFYFQRCGRPERASPQSGGANSLHHRSVSVPQDGWAPRAHIVYVFIPIGIEQSCPLGPFDKWGLTPDGAERADGAVDAARHKVTGAA